MPPPIPRSDRKAAAECDGAPARGTPEANASLSARQPTSSASPLAQPAMPLARFNAAPLAQATALLLRCCACRHWAARIAECRAYPDMEALLAAADEASYDMAPDDLTEALRAERAEIPLPGRNGTAAAFDQRGVLAAHTALRAAHGAYEQRFGHTFLVCLDSHRPDERLDQALAAVRSRLCNDVEEERSVAAEELRNLARGRLARLVVAPRTPEHD
jgi:2-oxo-4-hydroxy-4-carboxy-5-ureidoimidazoline decarboxylase